MDYTFTAMICGGIGPDVWDKEIEISATDMLDAATQATGQSSTLGGRVILIEENP